MADEQETNGNTADVPEIELIIKVRFKKILSHFICILGNYFNSISYSHVIKFSAINKQQSMV